MMRERARPGVRLEIFLSSAIGFEIILLAAIDYKPPKGILEGLWFRARAAFPDIDGDDQSWYNVREYRIIVNYNAPFL